MTVDELKSVIHEVITEDMDAWRETFEIMADKKLMKQINQADLDWVSRTKDSYPDFTTLRRYSNDLLPYRGTAKPLQMMAVGSY